MILPQQVENGEGLKCWKLEAVMVRVQSDLEKISM